MVVVTGSMVLHEPKIKLGSKKSLSHFFTSFFNKNKTDEKLSIEKIINEKFTEEEIRKEKVGAERDLSGEENNDSKKDLFLGV